MRHRAYIFFLQVKEWTSEQIIGLIAAIITGIGVSKVWDVMMKKSDNNKEITIERIKANDAKDAEILQIAKELALATSKIKNLEEQNKLQREKIDRLVLETDDLRNENIGLNTMIIGTVSSLRMMANYLKNDPEADPRTINLIETAIEQLNSG